jgi:glycosyltransferase involved in cell wall biosynthesis
VTPSALRVNAALPSPRLDVAVAPANVITVVVPVLNGMKFLPQTVPTLLAAGRYTGRVEFIYVDNGSTDGSVDYLRGREREGIRLYSRKGDTIARMRNFGARQGTGQYLSFIDGDCSIPERYFEIAVSVLRATGAAATGCEVYLPDQPHWIESAWHDLHYVGRDRDVRYLNSGNFFVSRSVFERVGGFREDLLSGEDPELGERLNAAGERIRACPEVQAIHLGNPKSIPQFYRRNVWHGLGMFGTVSWNRLDRPVAMLGVHLIATLVGLAVLLTSPLSLGWRGSIALSLQLVAPLATVLARGLRTGRLRSGTVGIFLYWLYYWARLQALALVTLGQSERYRK